MTGTDTEKVILTTFTDPMMGLSYETEPVYRKLETHFGDRIELQYCMSLLVRDVRDFMLPQELGMEKKAGIEAYCRRLAKIYEDEEQISGMPICMDGFCLFDEENTTSMPLNLAYKAAQLTEPDKAEHFLYLLRYATIVDTRPTTHFDEITKVVAEAGIDIELFKEKYRSGEAEEALKKDLTNARSMGIRSLPAYLLKYGEKRMLINALVGYDAFADAIGKLTDGKILPQPTEISDKAVTELIRKRKLICSVEIKEAFGNDKALTGMLDRIKETERFEMYPVKAAWYIKAE